MSFLQAAILGLLQGLTEFIPVSSTAHLLLAQALFKWSIPETDMLVFNVLVQMGTLLALIIYFRKDLWTIGRAWVVALIRRRPFDDPDARMGWYMILATIPALIGGVLFKNLVERLFSNPGMAAVIRLFLTAGLLLVAERFGQRQRSLESLAWKDALWIGIAQVLSVFPGASRSGSTITGGMLRNFDRASAARFAFLISVPVMLAAGVYEAFDLRKVADLASFLPVVVVAFVVAALVGYLAIRWLLNYLARRPLYDFALYCAVLAVIALIALNI